MTSYSVQNICIGELGGWLANNTRNRAGSRDVRAKSALDTWGSLLRTRIEGAEGIKAHFSTFDWSGDNKHVERENAGVGLANHIRELHEKFPDANKVVVAHSHGGNIALYATRRLRDIPLSIVTLGTPFFRVAERDVDGIVELYRNFSLLLLLAASIAFAAYASEHIYEYTGLVELQLFFSSLIVGVGFFFAILIALGFIILQLALYLDEKISHAKREIPAEFYKENGMLIVSTDGDEANFYLGALDYISGIPNSIAIAVVGISEVFVDLRDALIRFKDVFSVIGAFAPAIHLGFAFVVYFLFAIPYTLATLCLPIFMLSFFRRASSWDDSPLMHLFFQISCDVVPPNYPLTYAGKPQNSDSTGERDGSFRFLRLPRTDRMILSRIRSRKLNHSLIYERDDALDEIVRFITSSKSEGRAEALEFNSEAEAQPILQDRG